MFTWLACQSAPPPDPTGLDEGARISFLESCDVWRSTRRVEPVNGPDMVLTRLAPASGGGFRRAQPGSPLISIRSDSGTSVAPPRTVTWSMPSWKSALTSLGFMPSGSFILRLKWPKDRSRV